MASLIPNLGTPSADVSGAMRNYLMASQALNQAYQTPIDIINKLNAENIIAKKEAKQEARQAELDAQNKQLFDLKMAEYDRTNKKRETLNKFNSGMLEPQQGISGLITDSTSQSQVDKMAFTPEESAQYTAVGGDISKLTGSAKTKAELQTALSNLATKVSTSPEYQESAYEQAKRVASGLEMNPAIFEELKKYQVADINAQNERKKDQATYTSEAKELETKIAELKTKQGVKSDDILGLGKEWGKKVNSNGQYFKGMGYDELVKFTKEAAKTDSDTELRNMLKSVFDSNTLTKQQKEDAANNILISSGAYDSQGTFDIFRKNVDIDEAKKANEEYFAQLDKNSSINRDKVDSKEIEGLGNEIALLEARRQGALAKANAYSMDRTEAARSAIGSRIDELLGKTSSLTSTEDKSVPLTIRTNNPGAVKNASRTDKNAMWEGQTGFDEQGHAVFSSPEYGARAMAKNLQTQINKGNTLTSLLKEYATGNQEAYIKNVSNKTGIDPNTKLKESDIRNLMGAMVEHEAGVKNPFSADVLDKGYELALGKTPNSTSISPESKDVDVKSLFANIKSTKDKEATSTEINKLAELYKELGGDRSSAGPIDDIRINAEAINLSKKINVPAEQIVDTIKSQVRQENLINSRNEIVSKRMFNTNMNKLRKDPAVQAAYDKAWKEEARRRGYIGTSVRPFDIEEFIKSNYADKLQYK